MGGGRRKERGVRNWGESGKEEVSHGAVPRFHVQTSPRTKIVTNQNFNRGFLNNRKEKEVTYCYTVHYRTM